MASSHSDSKAKDRAVTAGVALGLARALAAKLPERHMISVRLKMLIGDLLQVPEMQVRTRYWLGMQVTLPTCTAVQTEQK
jgi:hypothetical protein